MRFRKLKQKNRKKQSQESLKPTIKYAKTTDRIKAFITDMFMIYIPILYIITYLVMGGKDEFQASNIAPFVGVLLYGTIYAFFLYKTGQTPGKKAYKIKVVDAKTHENITFAQAFLRFISFLFSTTILFGLIFIFYRKDKKSLHDIFANTIVISEE